MPVARLQWNNQTTTEDGFKVYKSLTSFDSSTLPAVYATLPPATNFFEDTITDLVNNYYFMVSVFKGSTEKFGPLLTYDKTHSITGPGSNVLVGHNDTAGFFGEVLPTDFITGSALITLTGLNIGINTASIDTIPWLKFALDDKILFVSKKDLRNTVSINNLQSFDLVNRTRVITIGQYQYKIGLLSAVRPDTDGVTWTSGAYDPEISWGSEWNRLMYNLLPESNTGYQASQVGIDWANYNQSDLVFVTYTLCKDLWGTSSSAGVTRGNASLSYLNYTGFSASSGSVGWRPCLELVTR